MIINDCFAKYGKPERAPAQTQHPEQTSTSPEGAGRGVRLTAFREAQAARGFRWLVRCACGRDFKKRSNTYTVAYTVSHF